MNIQNIEAALISGCLASDLTISLDTQVTIGEGSHSAVIPAPTWSFKFRVARHVPPHRSIYWVIKKQLGRLSHDY